MSKELPVVIREFTERMLCKCFNKAEAGFYGWDDLTMIPEIERKLRRHVDILLKSKRRSNAVDVANLAMMLESLAQNNE